MNQRNGLRAALIGITATTLLLVLGCDHADRGIFAQIEEEVRVNQANEGENGVVHSMVITDNGRYYAAANRLFWRNANADGRDWGIINTPNPSYQHVVSVATTTVPAAGVGGTTNRTAPCRGNQQQQRGLATLLPGSQDPPVERQFIQRRRRCRYRRPNRQAHIREAAVLHPSGWL